MAGDSSFRMTITDVFGIKGRGVVKPGDDVYFLVSSGWKKTVVDGLEALHRLPQARAGDNVGVLLRDTEAGELRSGDVLTGSGEDYSR